LIFQADYDEIELQKNQLLRHFSDVIAITSPKNVNKLNVANFFPILGPSQSKFQATPVITYRYNYNCGIGGRIREWKHKIKDRQSSENKTKLHDVLSGLVSTGNFQYLLRIFSINLREILVSVGIFHGKLYEILTGKHRTFPVETRPNALHWKEIITQCDSNVLLFACTEKLKQGNLSGVKIVKNH